MMILWCENFSFGKILEIEQSKPNILTHAQAKGAAPDSKSGKDEESVKSIGYHAELDSASCLQTPKQVQGGGAVVMLNLFQHLSFRP